MTHILRKETAPNNKNIENHLFIAWANQLQNQNVAYQQLSVNQAYSFL